MGKHNMEAAIKAAAEAHRAARLKREAMGIFRPVFVRLTLTEDAYAVTKDMDNTTFRKFASDAIREYAKRQQIVAA